MTVRPKRLRVAATRRDENEQPFVWDNELFDASGEVRNGLAPREARLPRPGSQVARVLDVIPLDAPAARSASQIAVAAGVTESQARGAINQLRGTGWDVRHDDGDGFYLDRRHPLTVAALAAWRSR
jgi:hypothetical protein